jgi:hypothetical protein
LSAGSEEDGEDTECRSGGPTGDPWGPPVGDPVPRHRRRRPGSRAVRRAEGMPRWTRRAGSRTADGHEREQHNPIDKYHCTRQIAAIREADTDGNPATEADTSWAPLFTPPYPDHASGANCFGASSLGAMGVLRRRDPILRDEQSVPGRTGPLRAVLRCDQRDYRRSHLGCSSLPQRGHAGGDARQEGRALRTAALVPAAELRPGFARMVRRYADQKGSNPARTSIARTSRSSMPRSTSSL